MIMSRNIIKTSLRNFAALGMLAVLAACSGGAPTQEQPVTVAPPVADYTGPAPRNADVQAFRVNVWENLKSTNRCGDCHTAAGQSPRFARNDDVNLAYDAALALVSLSQPDQSRLVSKVGGGHNCWLSADSACSDTMTVWIRNWAGATATGGTVIALQAPPIRDVGASKTFPESSALFASTVYPVLQQYCVRCHASNAALPQSPFFADNNVDAAYQAVKSKINLDTPASSRLVVRLRDEFHNCWSDCGSNAATMLTNVNNFANGIPLTQVDPSLVISKALTLYDGTVAAGGNRYEASQIALWQFKTGMGTVAFDSSGIEPAINLNFNGNVSWVGGWGIQIGAGGKAQASTASSRRLSDTLKASGEFTIEAWIAPANVMQEDAYIVSYSGGTMARNVTLAQREYQYQAMTRSSRTDSNGDPAMLTRAADEDAQATLQHVVLTYDPINGRRLFVNGESTGDTDAVAGGGTLADWDDSFALVLGNETSNNRQWQGVFRLAAIHSRALNATQIRQNFDAGVGERYFMLFNVSEQVNVAQSYIMFEAALYDSYSYLFSKPSFISLDPNARPDNIPIRGMRLGVNGTEYKVGQAYIPLNTTVTASNYTPATGQPLASIGTVVALEKGPDSDLFFLSFERIADRTHTPVEAPPVPPAPPLDPTEIPSDVGLRTFEEISATMAQMTGVSPNITDVRATYDLVRQALPVREGVEGFVASMQTGVAQLAIEYCNALAEDTSLRGSYFPGVNFSASASAQFGSAGSRDQVFNPLLDRVLGVNVASQPNRAAARGELDALAQRLSACGAGCGPDRTKTIVKASCAALIGSAVTLLQ